MPWLERVQNLAVSETLHFMCYTFARVHQTLKPTPSMAAGVTDSSLDRRGIVGLLDTSQLNRPTTDG